MAEIPEPCANPELFAQEAALAVLQQSMSSGRLHHAWLFTGPPGIGKATLAYRFARALLAGADQVDARLALDPDHPVFRQVAQGAHPDLQVIKSEQDARGRIKAEITVDLVRQATTRMQTTAAMGGWRVLLVDGAERFNRSAGNALLKLLEEPPADTVIILISHRPAQVLPTLRSRCTRLALTRLPDGVVAEGLARWAPDVDAADRTAVAALARGSLGRALQLATENGLMLYRRLLANVSRDPPERLALRDLALDLQRHADAHGMTAVLALIQDLLARVIAAASGRPAAPLFPEELVQVEGLARRRPLDHWPALWEKFDRLATAVDRLNLDRGQAFAHILTLLALGSAGDGNGPADLAPLGAFDVLA